MQTVSDEWAAIVDSGVASYDMRLTLGVIDVPLYASSFQVSASLKTDLPEGMRTPGGTSTRQLEVKLSGDVTVDGTVHPAAWLFGAYSASSPLYRTQLADTPVSFDIGIYTGSELADSEGVEWLRVFTGYYESQAISAGVVTITAYDRPTWTRTQIDRPPSITQTVWALGLTSEAIFDALLWEASNGAVSSCPPVRDGCILAVPWRTSLQPLVGTLLSSGGSPLWRAGVHGSAYTGANVQYAPIVTPSDLGYMTTTFFATIDSGASGLALQGLNDLTITPTSITLNTATTTTTNTGPHFWELVSTPTSAELRRDGATVLTSGVGHTWIHDGASWNFSPGFRVIGIEALQVSNATAPQWVGNWTPPVVLDPSRNPLSVIPEVTGEAWAAGQSLADAEGGVLNLDEHGIIQFLNLLRLRGGDPVATLTAANIGELSESLSTSSVAKRVETTITEYASGEPAIVYTEADVVMIPAGGSIAVTLDSPVQSIGPVKELPDGSTADATAIWVRASQDPAGLNKAPVTNFTNIIYADLINSTTVRLTNSGGINRYLVSSAEFLDLAPGTPTLWIGGVPITSAQVLVYKEVDNAAPVQTLDSTWLQDRQTALNRCVDVLAQTALVRPEFDSVPVVLPNPALQLADLITLQSTDLGDDHPYHALDDRFYIWGVDLSGDQNGITQSLSVRALSTPQGWLLGVSGRSELGETTWIG